MNHPSTQTLFEQYGYAVHRRCLRILGSSSEADDAVQEVFVRVIKYGSTRTGEAPLPWLYRIADRVCFDLINRRRRNAEPTEAERRSAAERAAVGSGLAPEDLRSIVEVLEACRTEVREVAVLYHLDQLTQEEVAARVGVSRKTVKQRLAKFMTVARTRFGITSDKLKEAS